MHLARNLMLLLCLSVGRPEPALAQFTNTMTGMQFQNMYAANADFMMSQMIQQSSWNMMRSSLETAIARKQAPGQNELAGPVEEPAAGPVYTQPLDRSDFEPAGAREVPEQLAAAIEDESERQQLIETCRAVLAGIEETPGVRPNNVASAMTVLLGVSLELTRGVELSDEESGAMMRMLNDMLAGLPAFTAMSPEQRTQLYDTMMITGGLIALTAQDAAERDDAATRAIALQMARDALARFGWES